MVCRSAKHGFHGHDAAMRAARQQMVRHRGMMLRVYRCPECKQWHMTSTPQRPNPLRMSNYLRIKRDVAI